MKKILKKNFEAYTILELLSEFVINDGKKKYDQKERERLEKEWEKRMSPIRKRRAREKRKKDLMLAENN